MAAQSTAAPSVFDPSSEGGAAAADQRSAEQTPAKFSLTGKAAADAMVPSQPEQCSISDHSAATQISSHSEHSSPCNQPLAWPCVLPALPALDLRLPSSVPALARTELVASPVAASPRPEATPSPIESDTSARDQRLTGAFSLPQYAQEVDTQSHVPYMHRSRYTVCAMLNWSG